MIGQEFFEGLPSSLSSPSSSFGAIYQAVLKEAFEKASNDTLILVDLFGEVIPPNWGMLIDEVESREELNLGESWFRASLCLTPAL